MQPGGGRSLAGGALGAGVCLGNSRHWKRTYVQDLEATAKR